MHILTLGISLFSLRQSHLQHKNLYRNRPLKGILSKISVWCTLFCRVVLYLMFWVYYGLRVQRNSFCPVLHGVSNKYKSQQENFRQSLDKMVGWGRQIWILCQNGPLTLWKGSLAPKTIAKVIIIKNKKMSGWWNMSQMCLIWNQARDKSIQWSR